MAKMMAKASQKAKRDRRSLAFKRNRDRYGIEKAKMIAAIITKKQQGAYKYSPKDGIRAKTRQRGVSDTTSAS